MKLSALLFILLLVNISLSKAQTPQEKLLKDQVVIVGDKMTITDFTLVTYSNGNGIQIKGYAEAPGQGVISRDNFVTIFTTVLVEMIQEFKKSDPKATTKDLDDVIGNADFEINIYMAKGGMQLETKSSQGVNRKTMQWSEVIN